MRWVKIIYLLFLINDLKCSSISNEFSFSDLKNEIEKFSKFIEHSKQVIYEYFYPDFEILRSNITYEINNVKEMPRILKETPKTKTNSTNEMCNNISYSINTTETAYYLNQGEISYKKYNNLTKSGKTKNLTTKEFDYLLCVCPKDYFGRYCEETRSTVCRFKNLYINGTDMYINYNTFYDELLNNSRFTHFNDTVSLNYSSNIICKTVDANHQKYYYNNPKRTLNIKENQLKNITFKYFVDNDGLVFSLQPNFAVSYAIYDMRALIPFNEINNHIKVNNLVPVITGKDKFEFYIHNDNITNSSQIDKSRYLVAGQLFYEIDLVDLNKTANIVFLPFHGSLYYGEQKVTKVDDTVNVGLIVGVVIGCVVIIAIIITIIFIYKKKKNQKYADKSELLISDEFSVPKKLE